MLIGTHSTDVSRIFEQLVSIGRKDDDGAVGCQRIASINDLTGDRRQTSRQHNLHVRHALPAGEVEDGVGDVLAVVPDRVHRPSVGDRHLDARWSEHMLHRKCPVFLDVSKPHSIAEGAQHQRFLLPHQPSRNANANVLQLRKRT